MTAPTEKFEKFVNRWRQGTLELKEEMTADLTQLVAEKVKEAYERAAKIVGEHVCQTKDGRRIILHESLDGCNCRERNYKAIRKLAQEVKDA